MKTISVIVPVYNTEAYLDRCIKSLFCQSYADLEIIWWMMALKMAVCGFAGNGNNGTVVYRLYPNPILVYLRLEMKG